MSHPAIGAGNNRKFAFIRVGYAKAPQGACDLLTTLSKGIFLCHTMSHNNTPKDVSLDRSLGTAFQQAGITSTSLNSSYGHFQIYKEEQL